MNKKITSILLAICMLVSCVVCCGVTASAANTTIADLSASLEAAAVSASYGLASKVEDGNILHCFDWKLSDIQAELPNIAKAGFTSVQTSPLQPHADSGAWYWLYQPTDSTVGNELGDYNALKSLCSEADKYGIKVIVDVVANHLAGWNDGRWNDGIAGSWRNSDYFHNQGGCDNWDNRYDVTHKNIGMPDLNSENSEVQNKFVSMVKSLQSAGVDGVRWDAAKHIGLPSEGCEFWAKISAVGMYNYGEILDGPAGNSGDDYNNNLMKEYANYIGVTDSSFSGHITGNIRDGKTGDWTGKWTNAGVPANRVVYWAESHDTYCNNGWTNGLSETVIDKAYAILAARSSSQALYLSRPYEHNHDSIRYGVKGSTHFTASEVAAVNHFHNAMVGTKEYFTSDNGCYVVCREGGAVIVSAGGGNYDVTVVNGGGLVKSGTYKDEVSGATWTVDSGSIRGHIGGSGIAVIYDGNITAGPSVSATPGSCTYQTDTMTVTLNYSEATSASYSVDGGSFQSFSNGQTITIGAGKNYGSETKVVVRASNGAVTDEQTYIYTKVDPSQVQTVYFDNQTYNWSQVYCYMYNESGQNAEWPGAAMTREASGFFSYVVPKEFASSRVLFTESKDTSDHRYPFDGDPGLELNGSSMMFGAHNSWTPYSGPIITPVTPTQAHDNPTVPPVPTGKILMGDADQDGSISIFDSSTIQKHLASYFTLTGNSWLASDVDADNKLTIFDATIIQKYLGGIPTGTKVGQYSDGSEPTPVNPTSPAPTPTTAPNPPVPSNGVTLNASATCTGDEAWYAWTWGSGEGRWIRGDGSASAVVFSDVDTNIIFCRVDPGMDADWNNGSVWNQTDDLITQVGGTYTTSGWAANRMVGSW